MDFRKKAAGTIRGILMKLRTNENFNPQKGGVIFLLSLALAFICICSNEDKPEETVQPASLVPEFSVEGTIIFHSNMDGDNEIYLLKDKNLTQLTHNNWEDEYPVWSPDGRRIAYTANPEENYDLFLMNPDGSETTRLTSSPIDEKEPGWFPDGKRIVFTREEKKFLRKQLTLIQIDIQNRKTERIIPGYNKAHAIANISPKGNLLTFTGKRTFGWDVAMYDLRSNEVKFLDEGGKSCRGRFSRDGTKLAYVSSQADGKGDIWIMNPAGSGKIRLTERDETYDYFPAWSSDDRFIVFNSSLQHDHNGDWALYVIEVKSREVRLLFDSPGNDVFPDWR